MSKTRVFVSSTCYDLSQVRDNLRDTILALGHEPVLSEYPSFPVNPDLDTISNCKYNVQNNADLFVLIIGQRKGFIDASSKKTVVNIEYETARENNIDSFIFVKQDLINLLPIWRANPEGDFSYAVDSSEVFNFIEAIQKEQKWTFCFQKSSDIIEVLKNQLSFYLRTLIEKKRKGQLTSLNVFCNESLIAQQIVKEKPTNWEYLLTIELLRDRTSKVLNKLNQIERGLIFKKSRKLTNKEYLFSFYPSKIQDMISLLEQSREIIYSEFPKAWGELGTAGNPDKIKLVIDMIEYGLDIIVDFELDLNSVYISSQLQNLNELLKGIGNVFIDGFVKLHDMLNTVIPNATPGEKYPIEIVLESPKQMDLISAEYERLTNDPLILIDE